MATPAFKIAYVDGPRLRRSLVAACDYAQQMRNELNRINVFPVPDGDTGTNLALTLRAIADHLRGNRDREVGLVAREAAEAAVLGARGNCGMMLSHFLLGFSEEVGTRDRLSTRELGEALTAGVENLYAAIERPVEGTILTVMRDTADAATASGSLDFVPLIDHLVERAKESLERTPDLLPALKKAGVVDAGAKGFVHLFEGILLFIHGDPLVAVDRSPEFEEAPVADVEYPDQEEQYRFCTEALVRGDDLPPQKVVRDDLRDRGDSLIVIRSNDVLKIHIHTDDPEDVFDYLRQWGTLATHKAEDMKAQQDAVERASRSHIALARRPVTVVVDSAADLPEEVVRAHGVQVVPMMLMDGDETLRDGVDITATEFHRRLGGPVAALPTTSQPAPAAFLEGYRRAAQDGEAIVTVVVGSTLSGTLTSAEAAAKRMDDETPVHVVDSLGASLLQGLLALKACELGELATPPEEIVAELERIREKSGILFTVDTFDRLLASGRVGKGRAFLGRLLSVKPILAVDTAGKVYPAGKALGSKRAPAELMSVLEELMPDEPEKVRFGVIHVGKPDIVPWATEQLRRRFGPNTEILTSPATPVISTHLGVGAWGIAWMVED